MHMPSVVKELTVLKDKDQLEYVPCGDVGPQLMEDQWC